MHLDMKEDGKTRPRSLVRQSADLIRERIVIGQSGPNLPGENELARMLDVSRPTIRGALGLLEGELIVAPASNGIARRVTKDWLPRTGGDGDHAIRDAAKSLLELLYPSITRYYLNRDQVCHAAVELGLRVARAGKPFDEAHMIPMRRLEGRSTGPAVDR